jgi:diguanylate cyclase (GGDEF)-like protein/PAS domain S-box-containing protein
VATDFDTTARHYAFLVQRELDIYEAANASLAAYVSASSTINQQGIAAFVRTARHFERLRAISAFGYLPRVAPQDVPNFERRIASEFPAYRVWKKREGADFHYPLLYGVHANRQDLIDSLRGTDYSSIPDRLAAIGAAQARKGPAASYAHTALGAPVSVIVTFTPASTLAPAGGNGAGRGLVFSVMGVSALFEGVDQAMGGAIDVEVYDVTQGGTKRVYDADGVPRAAPDRSAPYSYRGELRYADRLWALHAFAKPAWLAARADRQSPMVLGIGILLSLMAAYAVFRGARHYLSRQNGAALARRFEDFFETHPFAVYSMDSERRFITVNKKMVQELGVDRDRLIGQPVADFIVPDNRAMAAGYFREAFAGHAVAYHNAVVNAHGEISDLAIVLIPVLVGGEVQRVLGFAENITERKRLETELYQSRQTLQLILDTVPLRVFWKDRDSVYLGANQHMLEEAGLQRVEQIVGLRDDDLPWGAFAGQYRAQDREVMDSGLGRLHNQQRQDNLDGSVQWLDVSKVPLRDDAGEVVGLLGVVRDITDDKRMGDELLRRANYDSLSGLPNRAYFYTTLQQALMRADRRSGVLALLYFDIDRFKQINDNFGHDAGDAVIGTFAARVRGAVRESDFVARLGGDEFVLIVEGLAARADAAGVAEKLIAAVRPPFAAGTRTHTVTTSIGIAIFEKGMTADQLIKAADDAMYAAKRAGRNCFRALSPSGPA